MAVRLEFDEAWLRDYEKRTGLKAVPQDGRKTAPEEKKPSKYRNKRTEMDGVVYDSKHEARVAAELQMRARAGEFSAVARQVPFELPGGVRYVADFVVLRCDGRYDVLDAKSEATSRDKAYRIKKKLMKDKYGIEVQEV